MTLKLQRKKSQKGLAGLTTGYAYTVMYSILLCFLSLGIYADYKEFGVFSLQRYGIPTGIVLLSIIAALYRELWIFDIHKKEIRYSTGLWGFSKVHTMSFSEIEYLELRHFTKGSMGDPGLTAGGKKSGKRYLRDQVVFSIAGIDGEERVVEIRDEKQSGGRLEEAAAFIASFSGIRLVKDRERDKDVSVSINDLSRFQ